MVALSSYYRNLNNYLITKSGLGVSRFSKVDAILKPISQFSNYDDLKLPFTISGRLITCKTYKDKNYREIVLDSRALKPTTSSWVGIKIYKTHKAYEDTIKGLDPSVDEIVGRIVNTSWNSVDNAIDFVAEIYDKPIAYKMDAGLIDSISVSFSRDITVIDGKYYFSNIDPKEASLVFDPRDSDAKFKPAN